MRVGRDLCISVMAVALSLLACKKFMGQGEEDKAADTTTEESKSGDQPSGSEGDQNAPSGGGVGIAACDAFLQKWEKCIEKAPEVARPGQKQALETTRNAWKTQTGNPMAKAGLETACTQMQENMKQTSAAWGCEW